MPKNAGLGRKVVARATFVHSFVIVMHETLVKSRWELKCGTQKLCFVQRNVRLVHGVLNHLGHLPDTGSVLGSIMTVDLLLPLFLSKWHLNLHC